jgi:A/G-specific adenine glycosylase
MDASTFPARVLAWYDAHGRDLPWRARGRYACDPEIHDPYRILLSEMMLQQTQVPRVLVKYEEWLQRFPTEKDVAQARVRDVLLAWQGMGYNNRALRLKQCCEHVTKNGWPRMPDELAQLPGIGKYTAHAIACFAFGQRVPIVDVNVKLVYAPFVGAKVDDDEVWAFASSILPLKRFYDYNQALFDLGTVVKSRDLTLLPKELQALYAGIDMTQERRAEKLHGGYPMRLYRGCLVQFLREKKGHGASIVEIGKAFSAKLSKQPASFVLDVAGRLEKDGVVKIAGNRVILA